MWKHVFCIKVVFKEYESKELEFEKPAVMCNVLRKLCYISDTDGIPEVWDILICVLYEIKSCLKRT